MTNEGKWFIGGSLAIIALLVVILLWSILLWIGLGLALVALLVIGWRVFGALHAGITAASLRSAEAAQAWAEVEQAQAKAEEARAIAEQQRATAAALWEQRRMIPGTMVGLMLSDPSERERLVTWAQPRKVVYNGVPAAPEVPALPPANLLPQAHVWEVIEPEVGPNHFHLGTALDEQGRNAPVWVPLDGIITLVSIGPQGLGKTTLARSLALQQVMMGGDLAICDWFNDIAAEMGRYFSHCYSDPEDCEGYVVEVLKPEMDQRRDDWRAGRREFPALLWLIDEWAMLRKDCPAMAEALTQAFSVWRKLGLRTVVSSVALDTRELGISKSAVSTLALFSGNENLARTWGLSGIKPQLDSLYRSGKGYCLITSQHLQRQAAVLALPNVSADLFQRVIERRRPDLIQRALDTYKGLPPLPLRGESVGTLGTGRILAFPGSQESPQTPKGGILSPREREYIAERYRAGIGRVAVRDELRAQRRDGFSNRHWQELKTICDAIDRETGQEAEEDA